MNVQLISETEKTDWTEEEYFAGVGLDTELRYEFVRGKVFARTGLSAAHAEISSNIFVPLHQLLRGKTWRAFLGDMTVKTNFLGKTAFYIPDVMVACDENPKSQHYREHPLVLVEVMSPSTASADLREKLMAYTPLPSLRHYLIVNQLKMEVFHYYRAEDGWKDNTLTEPGEVIHIPELDFALTMAQLYVESGLP